MAIVGTLKTFKGGHYFKEFEGTPSGPILDATLPSRVRLPLRQGYGSEVAPVVAVGDSRPCRANCGAIRRARINTHSCTHLWGG